MIKTQSKDTFDTIQSAVNKMVDFIKPTLGPASNKVIIDKKLWRKTVDDGVSIARDFELEDLFENAVVKHVRETAIMTNDRVGDGTTTSLVILQGILREIAKHNRPDRHNIVKELKAGAEDAVQQIKKQKLTIQSEDDLRKVALTSFDNEHIADMVANLYKQLGPEAMIDVEKSPRMETKYETTEGIQIDRGYVSPFMVNNPAKMEAVVSKPRFLVTNYRITEVKDLKPILDTLGQDSTAPNELVILCENIESHALSFVMVNNRTVNPQGNFHIVAVATPNVENRDNLLHDIALMTGAKFFNAEEGSRLENAVVPDLGKAEKFISRNNESIIIKPEGDKETIDKAVADLKEAIEAEPMPRKQETLKRRLGRFSNTIGKIEVGASTDNEQKALQSKVEDAVHSVKAAYQNGVVAGSGVALSQLETQSDILNEALKYPLRQIYANMGQDSPKNLGNDEAINLVTGFRGPFLEVGVLDPVDSLVSGIESAVSIASVLLTSSGILVEEEEKNEN